MGLPRASPGQGPQLNDVFFDKNFHTPYTIHFSRAVCAP
jgi:hypothetical protein